MNHFKRLIAATMAVAMITSTFVTGFATNIAAKAPAYTIQMVGNTLTLMKNGVAFMPYRLSTVAGADAVKVYQTATGEVRLSFVDSTGKTRLIEIGKEANLEIKGTFPALVIDKSVTNTTVALATHNKNDRNAIPTIIRDLQVNGAVTLQIPVGAEVQKATVSNKETKVDIAKGSDVKNVTVADGVVVGGAGSSDTNVSTDTSLGGSTSGGSTSGGSTSGGSGSSGGSNSGDDEIDNEPAITTFTVTFNTDGGSKVVSQKVAKDGKVTMPKPHPTKTGYIFGGWYADKECQTPWEMDVDTITANTTLYAKFTPTGSEKPDTKFTVTFMNDKVEFATQSVVEGEKAKTPDSTPTSTDPDSTFDGWYKEESLTNKWSFDTAITADITLYAKFTTTPADTKFTVTFMNGESEFATQKIAKDGKATKPDSDPSKNDYRFDGWYKESTLETKWDFDTAITANTIIYAKFVEQVTVTFKDSGVKDSGNGVKDSGSVPDVVVIIDINTAVPTNKIPANPTSTDGTFSGWFEGESATAWKPADLIAKTMTLTARYTPKSN